MSIQTLRTVCQWARVQLPTRAAVAMAGRVGAKAGEKVVCVVSGGHIDATVLAEILSGVEEWNEDDVAIAKL